MSKRKRRDIQVFSLSSLDALSCGLGAMILLLLIVLASEPRTVQEVLQSLREKIEKVKSARGELGPEAPEVIVKRRDSPSPQLASARKRLAELREELSITERQATDAKSLAAERARVEGELKAVRQSLSEEMKRLLAQPAPASPPTLKVPDAPIGGIPVDSEYIIFIIDTSGSMKVAAWPLVVRKLEEVLNVHPQVKGFQVMNDIGTYMYSQYAREWIPDTPARRKAVIDRLKTWEAFSKSNPTDGILSAVRQFISDERHVSLYIFGDDFSSGTIDELLNEVANVNRKDSSGGYRVHIHAFGFPTLFLDERGRMNRTRFAHLMRLLADQNQGSFVGLATLK